MQTIHRARPLIRDVDIWLLTNVPLPNIPVEARQPTHALRCTGGVDAYRWPRWLPSLRRAWTPPPNLVTTADLVDAKLCQTAAAAISKP